MRAVTPCFEQNTAAVAQRKAANARSAEVRRAQRLVKEGIAAMPRVEAGPVVAEMLRRPSPVVASIRITQLLGSIRGMGCSRAGVGRSKVTRMLLAAGVVNGEHRVGELTMRQRCALAEGLIAAGRDAVHLSREQLSVLRAAGRDPATAVRLDGNRARTGRSLVRRGLARWEPPGTTAELHPTDAGRQALGVVGIAKMPGAIV